MLYIRLENSVPVEVSSEYPGKQTMKTQDRIVWARNADGKFGPHGWLNRNDIGTYAYAFTLAALLTDRYKSEQRVFLACNRGDRDFDVIEAPRVGDKVSKGFNGDYYPEGEITRITPKWQITTSTGAKFRRVKNTAGWRETGRGFSMVGGHIDERNPSY